jgi:hypothetical protein
VKNAGGWMPGYHLASSELSDSARSKGGRGYQGFLWPPFSLISGEPLGFVALGFVVLRFVVLGLDYWKFGGGEWD